MSRVFFFPFRSTASSNCLAENCCCTVVVTGLSRPVKNEHLSPGPVCLLSDTGGPLNFALAGLSVSFFGGGTV